MAKRKNNDEQCPGREMFLRDAKELSSSAERLVASRRGRVYGVEHVQHPSFGEGVKFWMTHPAYDEQGNAHSS